MVPKKIQTKKNEGSSTIRSKDRVGRGADFTIPHSFEIYVKLKCKERLVFANNFFLLFVVFLKVEKVIS